MKTGGNVVVHWTNAMNLTLVNVTIARTNNTSTDVTQTGEKDNCITGDWKSENCR